jgi:hypothetical protein
VIIYFRACEKQQTISNISRFNNIPKTELLKKCWISIQNSVSADDSIVLIEDSVSSDTMNYLIANSNTPNLSIISVPEHDWSVHQHTIELFDLVEVKTKQLPDELHYIVEDDYLHVPNAVLILNKTLQNWPYFATSYDYPDRYSQEETQQGCMLMLGLDRHWRSIKSAPLTLLAKGSTWLRHIDVLKQAAPTSNDKVLETIFEKELCISPIPALSSHMTTAHLSPLVNWEAVWDDIIL